MSKATASKARAAARPAKSSPQSAPVPMVDLHRQYAALREPLLAAAERVLASQRFILGEEGKAFEAEVAAFTGAAAAVGCNSGTDALWLALQAVGVGPGDEVLTTPLTFLATGSAIARAGARLVLVDIHPGTLNLDPEQVERRLGEGRDARLKAMVPVHLYGQCADMDAFQRLAREYRLALVEDAAQAFGAGWRGKRAGSLAVAAAFSFYPSKNLGACGDAGCVTTQDPALAERLRSLRHHGSRERYYHDELGWNSRLDELQAALLRVKLAYVEEWNNRRREHARLYDRLLQEAGLVPAPGAGPVAVHPVELLQTAAQAHHIYHQYAIRASRRDPLRAFLQERGISTEVYYPLPLHLQSCFHAWQGREGEFPEAERAAREVLALPLYPELTPEQQHYVTDRLAAFYCRG
jgi:dTDP-4-amino-4,6-dideoxygalactose transaminase